MRESSDFSSLLVTHTTYTSGGGIQNYPRQPASPESSFIDLQFECYGIVWLVCFLKLLLVFCGAIGLLDLLFLVHFVGYYGKLELQFTAGIKIILKSVREIWGRRFHKHLHENIDDKFLFYL